MKWVKEKKNGVHEWWRTKGGVKRNSTWHEIKIKQNHTRTSQQPPVNVMLRHQSPFPTFNSTCPFMPSPSSTSFPYLDNLHKTRNLLSKYEQQKHTNAFDIKTQLLSPPYKKIKIIGSKRIIHNHLSSRNWVISIFHLCQK